MSLAVDVEPVAETGPCDEANFLPTRRADAMQGRLVDGKYKVKRLLGKGGMGAVYEAEHSFTGQQVAIKILPPRRAQRPDAAARFQQEAISVARLKHEHIVQVLDGGEDDTDGTLYIVHELLTGTDLQRLLRRTRQLALYRASQLILPIMDALIYAHERGVLHRDLKPGNIFIAETEHGEVPKLIDFGIAKLLTPDAPSMKTREGMIMGTSAYMAPEALLGEPVDQRADVWGLGLVLYEMLAGRHPLRGKNHAQIIVAATEYPLEPISQHVSLPAAVQSVITTALTRDVAGRYPTMAAFRDAWVAAVYGEKEVRTFQLVLGPDGQPMFRPPAAAAPSSPGAAASLPAGIPGEAAAVAPAEGLAGGTAAPPAAAPDVLLTEEERRVLTASEEERAVIHSAGLPVMSLHPKARLALLLGLRKRIKDGRSYRECALEFQRDFGLVAREANALWQETTAPSVTPRAENAPADAGGAAGAGGHPVAASVAAELVLFELVGIPMRGAAYTIEPLLAELRAELAEGKSFLDLALRMQRTLELPPHLPPLLGALNLHAEPAPEASVTAVREPAAPDASRRRGSSIPTTWLGLIALAVALLLAALLWPKR